MTTNMNQPVGRSHGTARWTSRITGVTKVLGGILLLALLHHPVPASGVTLPGSYSATLAWNPSPDASVVGYYLHYGGASGIYTNTINAGNQTNATLSGLQPGQTYYIVAAAYNAAGLESLPSNELSYQVAGLATVGLRVAAGGQMILTVSGQIGGTYHLQASTNLINWTVISTGLIPAGGSLDVTDPNAASFPKRFYRIQ